jgi:hypothetical protein
MPIGRMLVGESSGCLDPGVMYGAVQKEDVEDMTGRPEALSPNSSKAIFLIGPYFILVFECLKCSTRTFRLSLGTVTPTVKESSGLDIHPAFQGHELWTRPLCACACQTQCNLT